MFGLTNKLADPMLYVIHDMVESIIIEYEEQLANTPIENLEEIESKKNIIMQYKNAMLEFENNINEQRKNTFQFSIEELFYMFGQYDKVVTIEFHKFSGSAKKFGRTIGGVFLYSRNERESLENLIASGNIIRTNDFVKFEASPIYEITNEQTKEMANFGFLSGDIYKILSSNTHLLNTYTQNDKKQIPNITNINFDSTGFDPFKLALFTYDMRLNDGGVLIQREWNEYCGYCIYYSPERMEANSIKEKIFDINGNMKKGVRFYFLNAKLHNFNITDEELCEFKLLLRDRCSQRLMYLEDELKDNKKMKIDTLKLNHPNIYSDIYKAAVTFEDSVLGRYQSPVLVYWDFRTYLHIFLRHCDELQPEGPFRDRKTPFSYSSMDIEKVLKIAVEELQFSIDECLLRGEEFKLAGDNLYYYNGDYYFIKIEPSGRLCNFFPYLKNL